MKKINTEKIAKLICILYATGAINIFGGWDLP